MFICIFKLQTLKADIENAVKHNDNFGEGYKAICLAMSKYQSEYPHSVDIVNSANSANFKQLINSILEVRI